MDAKAKLKEQYAQLCLQLGDLEYKIQLMSQDKDLLVEKLKQLNQLASSLDSLVPGASSELSKTGE